jgi:predicted MFS family arabinose efflux permease
LIFTTIVLNFDTGVFPPVLDKITKDLGLNQPQLAFLGNLPYFGICLNTPFIPYYTSKFSIKNMLIVAVLINIIFCSLFTISEDYQILCLCRLF